jgi:hypothetical protein
MNRFPVLNPKVFYIEIYKLLWEKNDKKNKTIFPFYIPDTILFIDDIPHTWIFTSKKNGIVMKKSQNKLKINEIISHFMKKNQQVVAYYMYSSDENKKVEYIQSEADKQEKLNLIQDYLNSLGYHNEEGKIDKTHSLLFEIIENKEFVNFMNNVKKRHGILQIYKESNDVYNKMFRIIWSPQISFYDVRKSRHPVSSKNYHHYEKVITFETEKFNIKTGNILIN